jgi:hypothetical protein
MAKVFLDVLEVAAPKLVTVTRHVKELATQFANWLSGAKDSGKLGEWLDRAMETFGKLNTIGGNLVGIIQAIFTGSSSSADGFLDQLIGITDAFEKWMKSADGQQVIGFFAQLTQIMVGAMPVWEFLIRSVQLSIDLFKALGFIATAAFEGLKIVIGAFVLFAVNGIRGVLMVAEKAARALGMDGLADKLKSARQSVEDFSNSVNNSLNGIQKDITITVHARMIGGSILTAAQQSGTYQGVGGRAAGGMGSGVKLTGERGPELVDFNAGRVHNTGDTSRIFERAMRGLGASGGGGGVSLTLASTSGAKDSFSDMFMEGIRRGWIQLFANGKRVQASV